MRQKVSQILSLRDDLIGNTDGFDFPKRTHYR